MIKRYMPVLVPPKYPYSEGAMTMQIGNGVYVLYSDHEADKKQALAEQKAEIIKMIQEQVDSLADSRDDHLDDEAYVTNCEVGIEAYKYIYRQIKGE